jgi:RNA recognition motif-containing protein
MAKIFIGGVSSRVSKREIEELFGKHGKILECTLKQKFAFV